jgi:hypothetical protein
MTTIKNDRFETNQTDLGLDDIQILWTGQYVQLYKRGKLTDNPLTTLRVSAALVPNIMRWCLKNSYRCSQIRGGKICL